MVKYCLAATLCLVAVVAVAGISKGDRAVVGTAISDDDASKLIGGACLGIYGRNCGGGACGTAQCACIDTQNADKRNVMGNVCNDNCSIYLCGTSCTS